MKIQPIAGPAAIQQAPSNEAGAKARAVAAFNQATASTQATAQPTQQVVQNQNNIAVEELGAIKAQETEETTEVRQSDTNVEAEAKVDTEAQTSKPAEDPALSRQFAQLARQEKALRAKALQQEQAYKAREAAIAAREAELTGKPQFDQSKYISLEELSNNTLDTLARAGVSYEKVTQDLISQQPVDPRLKQTISQLQQEIQQLKNANEQAQQSYKEQQSNAYKAALQQIHMDARDLVRKDPNFETIKATNSVKDVVDLIEQTYQKDKILLTVEEAAQQVEDYLVEEATKLTKIEKIKRKIQESAPNVSNKSAQALAEKAVQKTQPMKTLTNATSSTRQLSAKERAILAFKGELDKS